MEIAMPVRKDSVEFLKIQADVSYKPQYGTFTIYDREKGDKEEGLKSIRFRVADVAYCQWNFYYYHSRARNQFEDAFIMTEKTNTKNRIAVKWDSKNRTLVSSNGKVPAETKLYISIIAILEDGRVAEIVFGPSMEDTMLDILYSSDKGVIELTANSKATKVEGKSGPPKMYFFFEGKKYDSKIQDDVVSSVAEQAKKEVEYNVARAKIMFHETAEETSVADEAEEVFQEEEAPAPKKVTKKKTDDSNVEDIPF